MASRLNEGNFVRFQGKTPTGVRTEEIEKCLIIGSLRYGDYGLRTTSGRENPSHAWTGPTTLKGRENWSVV